MNEGTKGFLKKYGLWIVGGIAGLYLVYKYMGSSGSASSGSSSLASQYAATLNAQNQYSAQAGQYALQQNAQAMEYAQQTNQLNAQLAATQMQQEVAGIQAAGSTLSSVIGVQSALPTATINAAAAQNQQALSAAAQVASAGLSAVPGSVQGAAFALQAAQQPWDAVAQAVSSSGGAQAFNSMATSLGQSAGAAASSANASIQASNQQNAAILGTIGTVAGAVLGGPVGAGIGASLGGAVAPKSGYVPTGTFV